jgi:flagellar hook-basal body complex protein FliE
MVPLERIASAAPESTSSLGHHGLTGEQSSVPFSATLQSMLQQTTALSTQASSAVEGLLNGRGVEIHDVLIATQKASLAFELALQIRNKAVAAYQQMSGMQF